MEAIKLTVLERNISSDDLEVTFGFLHEGLAVSITGSSVPLDVIARAKLQGYDESVVLEGPSSIKYGESNYLEVYFTFSWSIDPVLDPYTKLKVKVKDSVMSYFLVFDGPDDLAILWRLIV